MVWKEHIEDHRKHKSVKETPELAYYKDGKVLNGFRAASVLVWQERSLLMLKSIYQNFFARHAILVSQLSQAQ